MKGIFTLLIVSMSFCASAQNHTIKGKIKGLNPTDSVYLAQYLGKSLFYNDTAVVAKDGYFTFEGKPFEKGGKYAIVTPGPKLLEIILDSEDLVFESDTTNLDTYLNVSKSENNIVYNNFKKFIAERNKLRGPIDIILRDSTKTEKEKKEAREQLTEMTKEVMEYQKNLVKKHGDKLVGKMINMTMEVEVPEAPKDAESAQQWRYEYYRNHYWDNVDLDDPRIVRDQAFHRVLEKYLTKVIPQNPDSVAEAGAKLVNRVEKNYDMFKYTLHQLTYLTETSKVMCMDKAFVKTVFDFYKTGKVDWLTDEKLAEIIKGAEDKEKTLCGEIAPNIILPDTTEQKWFNLQEVDAEYTVLVFWESGCGHCKKELPKLKKVYDQWHDKGFEVFAVGHELENKDWKKFIKEKELDWINVSFNEAIMEQDSATQLIMAGITTINSLNYSKSYDITSTPQIYLLDKNKQIMFKQLNAEQLERIIADLLGKDESEQ